MSATSNHHTSILYDRLSDITIHRQLWLSYWNYSVRTKSILDIDNRYKFIELIIIIAMLQCQQLGKEFVEFDPRIISERFFKYLDEYVVDFFPVPSANTSPTPPSIPFDTYTRWIQAAIKHTVCSITVIPTLYEIEHTSSEDVAEDVEEQQQQQKSYAGSQVPSHQSYQSHHSRRQRQQKPPRPPPPSSSRQPPPSSSRQPPPSSQHYHQQQHDPSGDSLYSQQQQPNLYSQLYLQGQQQQQYQQLQQQYQQQQQQQQQYHQPPPPQQYHQQQPPQQQHEPKQKSRSKKHMEVYL